MLYALAVPNTTGGHSDLYLATENESGALVASGFPEELESNESEELTVGVKNREGAQTAYSVVVELQKVGTDSEEPTVQRKRELHRFSATLDAAEDWHRQHEITPEITGDNLRVRYYLYKGAAPDEVNAESAYRTAHIWITVSDSETG